MICGLAPPGYGYGASPSNPRRRISASTSSALERGMSRLATQKSPIATLRARRLPAGDREARFRGTGRSFHGSGARSRRTKENAPLTCGCAEPPIGIEPMTYALRVRRSNRLS
jgi:hypothetical protein